MAFIRISGIWSSGMWSIIKCDGYWKLEQQLMPYLVSHLLQELNCLSQASTELSVFVLITCMFILLLLPITANIQCMMCFNNNDQSWAYICIPAYSNHLADTKPELLFHQHTATTLELQQQLNWPPIYYYGAPIQVLCLLKIVHVVTLVIRIKTENLSNKYTFILYCWILF